MLDYRRELMKVYKNQIGICLTNLRNLKNKTDSSSLSDIEHNKIILGINVKKLAALRRDHPDISGPRCRQLCLVL